MGLFVVGDAVTNHVLIGNFAVSRVSLPTAAVAHVCPCDSLQAFQSHQVSGPVQAGVHSHGVPDSEAGD